VNSEWRLREHRREDNLTSALNYAYSPGPHPNIDYFLRSTVPDPGGQAVIMAHIGLAILRDMRHRHALVLIGPPNSGKTVMLRLILATCGQSPTNFAPAAIFFEGQEGDRKRASWGCDRMAAIDELPSAALSGESLPKAMMAHSGVPMRQMYAEDKRENQWLPKITMTSNDDPRIRDQSRAMMSRLLFVDCPVSRREKRRDEAFDPAIHVDMKLGDRLVEEVPAFAVTCIHAGVEAQRTEAYPVSEAMEARASQIARDGDSIKAFVEDCCTLAPEAFTHGDDLFEIYATYCSHADLTSSKKPEFRKGLLASFPAVRPHKKRIAGRGENPLSGFSGIGVQAEVLSYFPDRGIYSFKTA
jgi:phage/plasmid-associated DNA primase